MTTVANASDHIRGIAANRGQFTLQALQVFFVGLVIGMERAVLPTLAHEFGVAPGAFLFLASFVLSFGLVKGALNLVAGGLADRFGRKPVLIAGWIAAIPIPLLIWAAPNWWWIVIANVFLGISQGFTWTMTVTSQIDLAGSHQRGLAVGINEATGYVAVGLAGAVAALLAEAVGARNALLIFGMSTIVLAFATITRVRDTLAWVKAEHAEAGAGASQDHTLTLRAIFVRISFRDRVGRAICQGGIVNKIADTLVWVMFPLFFKAHGAKLIEIGWLTGTYAMVWGVSQLWTGHLGDRVGRRAPVIAGFFLLAAGIAITAAGRDASLWLPGAIVMGVGMALLYPNLIAAMSDQAAPLIRGKALGTYRYWRDTGYALGALLLGLIAQFAQATLPALWITAVLVAGSGIWLMRDLPRPQ
ncbi:MULTISPECIES: MFS transporter [unclassified Acidiphilium]|uniref:MFS transporter n=1 Tax=unclassified Acidiphilium TaxID=2617493 RepID=UPI000BD9F980|nr:MULTISPECIES: MFS transporter [unclassified Acidiphilium]OYV54307.1 MAG: MFS transporter [Acidiphilium sp. 20-67-58]HQT62348.1 MFS transporter [Acidiphilium sp.]